MMGAIAFQKGLGVVHSCAHALGTVFDLHHGLANGVMVDHALAHNVAAVPERFARLAQALGLERTSPDAVVGALAALKADVGVPSGLREMGLAEGCLDDLVRLALADSCHANNPVAVDAAGFEAIFRRAWA
jgi:alcohol dehydrogenase class IV